MDFIPNYNLIVSGIWAKSGTKIPFWKFHFGILNFPVTRSEDLLAWFLSGPFVLQHIPPAVTFSKARSKVRSQSL